MHKLVEHVAGGPVWTHEMAERALWDRLSARVFAQHPAVRDAAPWNAPTDKSQVDAYVKAYVAGEVARLGVEELDVAQGEDMRTEHPVESLRRLAPDKPIVVVETPEVH
jgi:hypothetical protein